MREENSLSSGRKRLLVLSVGGRKSREAGVQPRNVKSIKAMLVKTAEKHCQVRSG